MRGCIMPAAKPAILNFIAKDASKSRVGQISLRGYIGESNQDFENPWYGGVIEAWGAGTVKELETEIGALNVDEIQLLVTSEGGSFFDALTIADILNRHPARIVAIVEGYAFSAATVLIAKCADEIRMASNAFQMIHPTAMVACGTADDLMAAAKLCTQTTGTAAAIYAARGGASVDKFTDLMNAESYLDGTECKAFGLADTLTDAVVLSNYRPGAETVRNEKTRARMPEALRALFDTPKPANPEAPKPTATQTPPDMTPEEIQALITAGIATGITAHVDPLKKLIADQGTLIGTLENANKDHVAKLGALETTNAAHVKEIARITGLEAKGVLTAAAAPGAPVVAIAAPSTGAEKPKLDFNNMTSEQLINAGRKALGKDKPVAMPAEAAA